MRILKFFKRKKAKETAVHLPDPHLGFKGISTEDLDLIKRFGIPSNSLGGYVSKSFVELPYGLIRKDLPHLQKQERHLEYITMILSCQFETVDLRGVSANDILAFMLWIRNEQEKIYKIEEIYLSAEPDPDAISAGLNRLDEFGALSTIHSLAGGDILKHPAIEALPYYKVYEVLKLEKAHREIAKNYEEIQKKKPK